MFHHYAQRGFSAEWFFGLGPLEKLFYYASMELALEDEKSRLHF